MVIFLWYDKKRILYVEERTNKMEKRFIIIMCEELKDQRGCDANRTVELELFTEEEVKEKRKNGVWFNYETGKSFLSRKEALKNYAEYMYFEILSAEDIENFDLICDFVPSTVPSSFECYEIKDNYLKYRGDLSTYNS